MHPRLLRRSPRWSSPVAHRRDLPTALPVALRTALPTALSVALPTALLAVLIGGLTVLAADPGVAATAATSPASSPARSAATSPATGAATATTASTAATAARSAATTAAQRRLNDLGCAAGRADGRVGLRTRTALVRFQSANRLRRSGALTAATRRRLTGTATVRCDRRPVVRSGTGRRAVISQRQNYLWLLSATGRVLAQGGIVDNPAVLRKGTYRSGSVCGRAARIRDNSDASGRLRLHDFVRFAPCGIGFHQIPQYRSTGAQIHPDYLLGTDYRTSHGCIRVSGPMSAKIWRFVVPGTKVVVR